MTAGAAMPEPDIRVALLQNVPRVSFRVSGDYTVTNQATGGVIAAPAPGEVWEVRAAGGLLQVCREGVPVGAFSGPVRVEQSAVEVAIAGGGGQTIVRTGTEGLAVLGPGNEMVTLGRDAGAYQVLGPEGRKTALKPGGLHLVAVQQANGEWRRYRGNLEIRTGGEGLLVINELPLEQYLYSVVPSEMPSSWPLEALKAQALAARTYALKRIEGARGAPFHVTPTQDNQVYHGYDHESPSTTRAVEETRGKVLVYATPSGPSRGGVRGELVDAFFHSSNGGFTERAEDVWLQSVPYLEAKPDPYDANPKHYNWQVVYTAEQLMQKLNDWLTKREDDRRFAKVTDLEILEHTASGARVKKMAVTGVLADGTPCTVEIGNADRVRQALGLKSALFTMEKRLDATGNLV
ncbi:MAG: SpoIID/LytB domain-containing protein, partial [Bacillota bacterium]